MTTPTHIDIPALREKAKSDRIPPQIPMSDAESADIDGDKWPISVAAAADEALGQAPGVTVEESSTGRTGDDPTVTSSMILVGLCADVSEEFVTDLFGVKFRPLDDIPEQRDASLEAAVRAVRDAAEREVAEGRPAPLDLPVQGAVRPGLQPLAAPVDRARKASHRPRRTWRPATRGWLKRWLGDVEQPTTERGAA